jgi:L-amino acid N-acyltransferase YncA
MSLLIRDATEADLPRILEIFNDAIVHTTAVWTLTPVTLENRRAWLRDRLANGFPVVVAEANGEVAGFASYGVFRAFEGFKHTVEHSVYVHEHARGRGIGRTLLSAMIAHAERGGIHVMVGAIDAENGASIALHKSAGFVEAGVLRESGRKFGRWLDMLSMQKILGGAGHA